MEIFQNSMQRRNGLEQSARAFQNLNKITPENKKKITNIPSNAPPIVNSTDNNHPVDSNSAGSVSSNPNTINRKRYVYIRFLEKEQFPPFQTNFPLK